MHPWPGRIKKARINDYAVELGDNEAGSLRCAKIVTISANETPPLSSHCFHAGSRGQFFQRDGPLLPRASRQNAVIVFQRWGNYLRIWKLGSSPFLSNIACIGWQKFVTRSTSCIHTLSEHRRLDLFLVLSESGIFSGLLSTVSVCNISFFFRNFLTF